MPPKDVPASELFQKLQTIPRPYKVVDFPRYDANGEPIGQIAVRVLTQEEQFQCSAAAESFTRQKLKAENGGTIPGKLEAQQGYEDIYNNAIAVELVFRAFRDVNDVKWPAFRTKEEIRQTLTNTEIGVLINYYQVCQQEFGPIVAHLTPEEMEAWIARLKEGASAYPLGLLSSDTKNDLLMYMASLWPSLPTDTSLPGSPADELLPTTPPATPDRESVSE